MEAAEAMAVLAADILAAVIPRTATAAANPVRDLKKAAAPAVIISDGCTSGREADLRQVFRRPRLALPWI